MIENLALSQKSAKLNVVLFSVILLLLLLVIYSPLFFGSSGFSGDDNYYIVNNARVHALTLKSLAEIWLKPMKADYLPVTITSYAVDYALWGLNPKMFRFTNLIIFVLIGIMTYLISIHLLRGSEKEQIASLPALTMISVFVVLLHPTQVENVASPSNRKELLYVLFGLLAFRSYLLSRDTPLGVVKTVFFVIMAQLSKGTAVILPALFLLHELSFWTGWEQLKRRVVLFAALFISTGAIFFCLVPRIRVLRKRRGKKKSIAGRVRVRCFRDEISKHGQDSHAHYNLTESDREIQVLCL